MPYASQTDLETHFGTTNVATWSNPEGGSTSADATRIAAALAYADDYIHDRFRGGPYAVPFTASSHPIVTRWAAVIATEWLYSGRGFREGSDEATRFDGLMKGVHRDMDLYINGSRRLPPTFARNETGPSVPVVVF